MSSISPNVIQINNSHLLGYTNATLGGVSNVATNAWGVTAGTGSFAPIVREPFQLSMLTPNNEIFMPAGSLFNPNGVSAQAAGPAQATSAGAAVQSSNDSETTDLLTGFANWLNQRFSTNGSGPSSATINHVSPLGNYTIIAGENGFATANNFGVYATGDALAYRKHNGMFLDMMGAQYNNTNWNNVAFQQGIFTTGGVMN
ncbi:MAG: hypothetical protein VKK59_02770 [Vampirovibrionales bacterium]|nr:hypothetical protein [Vampirovibrionales bacterium]